MNFRKKLKKKLARLSPRVSFCARFPLKFIYRLCEPKRLRFKKIAADRPNELF